MDFCIIMCRSLTYAQRAARVLEKANIGASLTKAPQGVTPEGCTYGVRVRQRNLARALRSIKEAGIRPGKVYLVHADGRAEEAEK